jgi:hypothetical protein
MTNFLHPGIFIYLLEDLQTDIAYKSSMQLAGGETACEKVKNKNVMHYNLFTT